MGKKNKTGLGRALVKDRFSKKGIKNDSMLHTSDLNDATEWGRLNLQSVTEESTFDDFLRTAELAGTEFQAERLNISVINPVSSLDIITPEERTKFEKLKQDKKKVLRIPRRPKWSVDMSADELRLLENQSFIEWRSELAKLQEIDQILLTPYEKNLEFWRQLWRTIERSDVLVQILDARNPLMFRCEDLEAYVKEVSPNKINFLLINKSDFLTAKQREAWALYFDSVGIQYAFFSATLPSGEDASSEQDSEDEGVCKTDDDNEVDAASDLSPSVGETDSGHGDIVKSTSKSVEDLSKTRKSKLLNTRELVILFDNLLDDKTSTKTKGYITIGLVGYPNVGKSSTINTIMGMKKVAVSMTPGRTKHIQTLYVPDSQVILCDCPGLVMPSMVATKSDMILSGILSINTMTNIASPVALLRTLLNDSYLENTYSVIIPNQGEHDDGTSPYPFLNSLAYSRGFMTQRGQPDASRASRIVLKDFVSGKLLYCTAPPGVDQQEYHVLPCIQKKLAQLTMKAAWTIADEKPVSTNEFDKNFFRKPQVTGVHSKGSSMAGKVTYEVGQSSKLIQPEGKPWKDHSWKRNRRAKLKSIYGYLDR